jgi:hypothetical protein
VLDFDRNADVDCKPRNFIAEGDGVWRAIKNIERIRPRSGDRPLEAFSAYPCARRGGLSGAGGTLTAPTIAANIARGF